MMKRYICSECGYVMEVDIADKHIHGSEKMECPVCKKRGTMRLDSEDNISYKSLTKAEVNESNIQDIVIPDTKNVLSKSVLANLVTLRAAVKTVYGLQSQINSLNKGISDRKEEVESSLKWDRESEKRVLDNIGKDQDYRDTYAKISTSLVNKNRRATEESDKRYAKTRSRLFTFLHIGVAVLFALVGILLSYVIIPAIRRRYFIYMPYGYEISIIILIAFIGLGVAWYVLGRRKKSKYRYDSLLEKKQSETEKAYIGSEQYNNELNMLMVQDFENRKKPLIEGINDIDATLIAYRAKDSQARADIAVLKKALKQEIDYLDGIYRNIIHRSDWENLDYIIYVFLTGRADNLKEALHMVDEQRRTDMIIKAIGMASSYLASNIASAISSVNYEIKQTANSISAELSSVQSKIQLQNTDYQNKIDRIVDINKNICDYSRMSYDIMHEINSSLSN